MSQSTGVINNTGNIEPAVVYAGWLAVPVMAQWDTHKHTESLLM